MATASANVDRPRFRRWFQWRLRTLLLAVMLVAAATAAWLAPYERERQLISRLRKLKATVVTVPGGPAWLQRLSDDPPIQHATEISFERADRSKIADRQLAGIENCHSLQSIDLEGCSVGDEIFDRLGGLANRTQMRIAKTNVTIGAVTLFATRHPKLQVWEEPGYFLFAATQVARDAETATTAQLIQAIRLATRWRVAVADQGHDRPARRDALQWQAVELRHSARKLRALLIDGAKGGGDIIQVSLAELAAGWAELELARADGDELAVRLARSAIQPLCRVLLRVAVDNAHDADCALEGARLAAELLADAARAEGNRAGEKQIQQRYVDQLARLVRGIAQMSDRALAPALATRADVELAEARAYLAHLRNEPKDVDGWAREALTAAARMCEFETGGWGEFPSYWNVIHAHRLAYETRLRLAELRKNPKEMREAKATWRRYLGGEHWTINFLYRGGKRGGEAEILAYIQCLEAIERLQEEGDKFLALPLRRFTEPEATRP